MESYHSLITSQREFFRTNQTKDVAFRLNALKKLRSAVKLYEREFITALKTDLNKSEFEAYSTEIGIILEELRFTISKLRSWVKPVKVKTPITHIGSASYVYSEPYGTTLIISPWNYPFQLAAAPLIGAISAGNCAIIKPSELTPRTSQVFAKMIRDIFPQNYVTVVQGGVETSQALLQEEFGKIFFTGSILVGKTVMEAAAKHLTPVTLELGGKSPCIVHEDASLKLAARRIAWGKFTNAGQTCIAPDYLYVHKRIKDRFLALLREAIHEMYEEQSMTRIVSDKHFDRLTSFLKQGEILLGGKSNREMLSIEPTILTDITWDDRVMSDEIFGPILPVLEYTALDDVVEGIRKHPNPLALYLFTASTRIQNEVLNSISFGGGCINDTIYHFANPHLPFGGVGTSGIGAYHGKNSFDVFSHKKSVLKQTTLFDIPFRYPHVKNALKRIKMFLK
ncbi:aldehyde dehydrogenase [Siminovitchia terrae]|uniref:Aldehyde dehydrogenase n=1 Tax=Siminovitchia terrae TaxID=1914933 RepID=A0A429XCA6_SIMTE|nr:aldehyde dehydrogenase [Siminovitchia terrae]RST61094.1 aldehyde dehydrogenase [Siminovitchia terrae]GIN90949.1 aldehyde dehydrogenase [Siminovitchia terrae]